MIRRQLLVVAASLLTLATAQFAPLASAQNSSWPNKPVRWINPFPAGGGTDVFARPMAAKVGTALGQTIIIENLAARQAQSVQQPQPEPHRMAILFLLVLFITRLLNRFTPIKPTSWSKISYPLPFSPMCRMCWWCIQNLDSRALTIW